MSEAKDYSALLKDALKNYVGETDITELDLEGLISIGKTVISGMSAPTIVSFGGDLFRRICEFHLTNDVYKADNINIMKDNKVWGAYILDTYFELLEPQANPSYNLINGQRVEQDTITAPNFIVKVYESKNSFEVPYTISDKMLRSAFINEGEFRSFVQGIEIAVDNSVEQYIEDLCMSAKNNFIALKYQTATDDSLDETERGIQVVNLLSDYNTANNTSLTVETCRKDAAFLKYCVQQFIDYEKLLRKMSVLFNIEKYKRFAKVLNFDVLSQFASDIKINMSSDVYHNELVALPNYSEVPFWQAVGTSADFETRATINITTSEGETVEVTGVIGFMYDERAIGITVWDETTKAHRNDHGEYTNYWDAHTSGLFNNLTRNALVFVLQDEPLIPPTDTQA